MRLVNGPTMYEGRVEVCDNGAWGTICDNGWGTRDVQAVCAQLGFGDGNQLHGVYIKMQLDREM